jgi:hypothetical protein
MPARSTGCYPWNGSSQLFPYEHIAANLFDPPTRNGIERRRAQHFPSPQAEARVMQWAPQLVADDQPFG